MALAMIVALPGSGAFPARAEGWVPRFGLEAGADLARMSPSDDLVRTSEHWTAGGVAGLLAEWGPAPAWSIGVAPRWERLVGRSTGAITLAPDRFDFDHRILFDRIAIPARVVWLPFGRGLMLEAGGGAAWIARARRDARFSGRPTVTGTRPATPAATIFEGIGTFSDDDVTHLFHRWDAALGGGIGWEVPFGDHRLRLQARYQHGLVDLARDGNATRLRSAEVTAGMLW
jgi:hypothetical protein